MSKVAVNDVGRRIGATHHNAKLPDETIRHIRDLHELSCLSVRDIAERLHLPFHYVKKIVFYERRHQLPARWKEIDGQARRQV